MNIINRILLIILWPIMVIFDVVFGAILGSLENYVEGQRTWLNYWKKYGE